MEGDLCTCRSVCITARFPPIFTLAGNWSHTCYIYLFCYVFEGKREGQFSSPCGLHMIVIDQINANGMSHKRSPRSLRRNFLLIYAVKVQQKVRKSYKFKRWTSHLARYELLRRLVIVQWLALDRESAWFATWPIYPTTWENTNTLWDQKLV